MKILLDYFFPIVANDPTPAASTAFLKQVCLVVDRKDSGVTYGVAVACTSMAAVAALTNNTEAQQLFNAGMSKVYILPMATLDLDDALDAYGSNFFTVLISSDFTDAEIGHTDAVAAVAASLKVQDILYTAKAVGTGGNSITIDYNTGASAGAATVVTTVNAIVVTISSTTTAATIKTAIEADTAANALVSVAVDSGDETDIQDLIAVTNLAGGVSAVTGTADGLSVGTFKGVIGFSSVDDSFLDNYSSTPNYAVFHTTSGNKAKNMLYAFGKLLSNSLDWLNQQYITMPFADDIETLGDANSLFDDKINFVISDDEFGKRLALFAVGGKAIVAPYIIRNLEIDLQSKALQYVSGNQPAYSHTQASLLEDEMQKVIDGTQDTPGYVGKGWLTSGKVEVKLEEDNFVASGFIDIPTPRALWRIFGSLTQS